MEIKRNNNRISKYFSLPPLNQTDQLSMLTPEDKLFSPTFPILHPQYIFGIEVEVEEVPDPSLKGKHALYWTTTVDNSLRNNGIEFVSLPLKAYQIEGALNQLNTSLPKTATFSPRTSVHVHMNVRDLSVDQIFCLLVLYTTVEELLFKWVGHNRDKSVFCVKITDTDYVQNFLSLLSNPEETVNNWNKYTALNLHPMSSKGTVEFRHLEGTSDPQRILTWINILSCLKTTAKSYQLHHLLREIEELNTSSLYEVFIRNIFGDLADTLTKDVPNLQYALEDAVSYIKLMSIQRTIQQRAPRPTVEDAAPYVPWGARGNTAAIPMPQETELRTQIRRDARPTTQQTRITVDDIPPLRTFFADYGTVNFGTIDPNLNNR